MLVLESSGNCLCKAIPRGHACGRGIWRSASGPWTDQRGRLIWRPFSFQTKRPMSLFVLVFGRRQQGGSARSTDRRPKSAKARSRGRL